MLIQVDDYKYSQLKQEEETTVLVEFETGFQAKLKHKLKLQAKKKKN